jgi:hypothetical protein
MNYNNAAVLELPEMPFKRIITTIVVVVFLPLIARA